jgi:DNA helicase-2/ATP-dependent DNA helicase PcrA
MNNHWLQGLNPAQREAVTYGAGPLLVVAGAGTGKTRTLACRVAHLIRNGTTPERILLLTFTRRAAAEMIRRAEELAACDATGRVWGGTFHATANRLLRHYGQAIDLPTDFTVIDEADAADLMNLIRNERGLGDRGRRFPRKQTLAAIYSRTVSAGDKLDAVLKRQFTWCLHEFDAIAEIFVEYTRRKREANVLDYDDLLLAWRTLCESAGAGETVAGRFDHVLVDEYQDTNRVQSDILRALRRSNRNIMVVGDDAQSIYSFRAATIRNILDFPDQFPGTHIVKLEENYRSTQTILDAANSVMAPARERFTKSLWSSRPSRHKASLVTCLDEAEQCRIVCERLLRHLERGVPLMRQAVLFRAGHHSDQLEVELARRKIPFHKFGGLKFIEAAHIKDMIAILRILENPGDEISWFRVLLLLPGIGAKTAGRIMGELGVRGGGDGGAPPAKENGERHRRPRAASVTTPLKRMIDAPPRPPADARRAFEDLRATLKDCSTQPAPPIVSQIERICEFYRPLFEARYDNHPMRLRDLEQLEQIAGRYRSRGSFITDLTLDPPTSTSELAGAPYLDEDWLTLSTIHSAKGCEWQVVHILHVADGMIPSDMALVDDEGAEEERRLLYVAMTRAKDDLYLYFPLRYYHRKHAAGDAHSYAQLSRFLTPDVRRHLHEQGAVIEALATGPRAGSIRAMDEKTNRQWMPDAN